MVKQYKEKPMAVYAIQWTGDNMPDVIDAVVEWTKHKVTFDFNPRLKSLAVVRQNDKYVMEPGGWIVNLGVDWHAMTDTDFYNRFEELDA